MAFDANWSTLPVSTISGNQRSSLAIRWRLLTELHRSFRPIAEQALRILSYGYIFYAWGMATVQGFNGAGDTVTPTWIHFFCFWVLEVPLALILARVADLGPPGVFWSVCISEGLLAVVAVILFRRGGWKSTKLAPDVQPNFRSSRMRIEY